MNVLKKSYEGSLLIPIETSLAENRIVFVEGEINQMTADLFSKQILHLVLLDHDSPIKMVINSPGGDIDAGLKMCDIVSSCPCLVHAFCFGRAYSMAAVLFESVNGDRNMVGFSRLMLHQPSVEGVRRGSAREIEDLSNRLREKNEMLLSIVSKRSGMDLKRLKKETITDRYFGVEEAISLGLADREVSFFEMINDR